MLHEILVEPTWDGDVLGTVDLMFFLSHYEDDRGVENSVRGAIPLSGGL